MRFAKILWLSVLFKRWFVFISPTKFASVGSAFKSTRKTLPLHLVPLSRYDIQCLAMFNWIGATLILLLSLLLSLPFLFQEKGECYTCGSNSFGQLGFPKGVTDSRPSLVKSLAGKVISHIACGDTFTVAVTAGSLLYNHI